MTTRLVHGRQGALGILSIVLALLGFLFFWIQPFGVILSSAGIITGLIGVGASYSAGGRPVHQAAAGVLLSVIALLVSLSIPLILHGDLPSQVEPARQALPTISD